MTGSSTGKVVLLYQGFDGVAGVVVQLIQLGEFVKVAVGIFQGESTVGQEADVFAFLDAEFDGAAVGFDRPLLVAEADVYMRDAIDAGDETGGGEVVLD